MLKDRDQRLSKVKHGIVDLIGIFSSLGDTNIQVGYPIKQEFHIRYNKLTAMVENKDHLL